MSRFKTVDVSGHGHVGGLGHEKVEPSGLALPRTHTVEFALTMKPRGRASSTARSGAFNRPRSGSMDRPQFGRSLERITSEDRRACPSYATRSHC